MTQLSDKPRVGRLLVADTEPSLASGTAIPPLPDVPCGVLWDYLDPVWVEATACEFDTEDAAEQYLATWQAAIAEPAPVWFGIAATTEPITDLPDWEGRLISIPQPSELRKAQARGDLVRRFGTRVYVATSFAYTEVPTDVVAPVTQMATAQQDFVAANNIADAPGLGRSDELDRLSVRYLVPTWQELTSLGTQGGGTPAERYRGLTVNEGNALSEGYSRSIEGVGMSESGYELSITADIEMHKSVGAAQRDALSDVERHCGGSVNPLPDSPNSSICLDGAYGQFAVAQDGRLTLTLNVPAEVGADPAAIQQIMTNWEKRVEALGFPIGAGEVEPITIQSRTDAPLPTDYFDETLGDGAFMLTSAYAAVADGAYTSTGAEYADGPQAANGISGLNIKVAPSISGITDRYGRTIDASTFGEITADVWATSWELDNDSGDLKSYTTSMARLLPSGAVLVLQGDVYIIGGPEPAPDTPFLDPADPLVAGLWDRFQDFSFANLTPDSQQVEARGLAQSLTWVGRFSFSFDEELMPVFARVAPDSPAGTVAEWREVSTPRDLPAVTQQVINFTDADAAAAYVQQVVGDTVLTPFADVDAVSGGYSADAGLIVASRGKWVVTYTSPGRTSWASPGDTDIPIEIFATSVARNLRATGLE